MIEKLKKNKGYTLVEILIVVALVGVIITPISLFFVSNLNSFYRGNDRVNAQVEAGRIMEELTSKALETKTYTKDGEDKYIFTTNGTDKWIFEYSGISLKRNLLKNSDTLTELSGNVTKFNILPESPDANTKSIKIELEVTYGRESCTLKNTVYFRNF